MNDISLIKYAAAGLYRIKSANIGYENGYIPELLNYVGNNVPVPVKNTGTFLYNNAKPILIGTALAGAGIYGYNKYNRWKKEQERIKRKRKVIPKDVKVPEEVGTIPSEVKASSYRKIKRVLNWIYS